MAYHEQKKCALYLEFYEIGSKILQLFLYDEVFHHVCLTKYR